MAGDNPASGSPESGLIVESGDVALGDSGGESAPNVAFEVGEKRFQKWRDIQYANLVPVSISPQATTSKKKRSSQLSRGQNFCACALGEMGQNLAFLEVLWNQYTKSELLCLSLGIRAL